MNNYFYLSQTKKCKKHNIAMYCVMGVIFLIALALLVISSRYENDKAISLFFNKAMNNKFIKGGVAYTVLDGYIIIISFTVPIAFLLFESLFIYAKQNKKKYKQKAAFILKITYIISITLYMFGCVYQMGKGLFENKGFGSGFSYGFIIGGEYIIPIFVISIIINFSICFSLSGGVHFRLARRKDFLTSGLGKKGLLVGAFLTFTYVPMVSIKGVMGRTYLINIYGDEGLTKIKEYSETRYQNYVDQKVFNFGGIIPGWEKLKGINNNLGFPKDEQFGPGGKMGKGMFVNPKPEYGNNLPSDDYSFPSGHIDEVLIISLALLTLFGVPETKKQENFRVGIFAISVLYILDMFFALEISLNHGTSDMAFSIVLAPFAYILGKLIIYLFSRIIKHKR